jgi:hypothetical protein
MRFLRQLFLRWANWLTAHRQSSPNSEAQISGNTTGELDEPEVVSRFIYSKVNISQVNRRPKRQAFDPGKYDDLSTLHSSGLLEREIWEFGQHTIGTQPGRTKIYGRADVPVKCLRQRKLSAIRDDNPFIRHTSVVGWPRADDPDEQKQKRMLICLQLSQDPDVSLAVPASADH